MVIGSTVLAGLALVAGSALTAPTATAASTALPTCTASESKHVGNGWFITSPSIFDRINGYNCNLKLGDHYSDEEIYDSVLWLQRNLNHCYGARLAVDGYYGAKTRAAVIAVQRQHRITADGIYGPRTRSAMKWRESNPRLGVWSQRCYSPI